MQGPKRRGKKRKGKQDCKGREEQIRWYITEPATHQNTGCHRGHIQKETVWILLVSEQSVSKEEGRKTHPPTPSNLLFLTGHISSHGTLNPHTLGCVTSREPLGIQNELVTLPNSLGVVCDRSDQAGQANACAKVPKSPEAFCGSAMMGKSQRS